MFCQGIRINSKGIHELFSCGKLVKKCNEEQRWKKMSNQADGSTATAPQGKDTDEVKKKEANSSPRAKKKFLFFISIANLILGLTNITFGIALLLESRPLPHWLPRTGFSIWYGFLVSISVDSLSYMCVCKLVL